MLPTTLEPALQTHSVQLSKLWSRNRFSSVSLSKMLTTSELASGGRIIDEAMLWLLGPASAPNVLFRYDDEAAEPPAGLYGGGGWQGVRPPPPLYCCCHGIIGLGGYGPGLMGDRPMRVCIPGCGCIGACGDGTRL